MFIVQPTGIGACRKCVNSHEYATRLINADFSENPPEIQSSLTATRHGTRWLPGLERPGYTHTAATRLQGCGIDWPRSTDRSPLRGCGAAGSIGRVLQITSLLPYYRSRCGAVA